MTIQHRRIYSLAALIILGMALLAVFWEFFLEDHVVPLIYAAYHPEPLYERVEYVITAALFATISLVFPVRQLVKNADKVERAKDALSTAYDDLEERVQERTCQLSESNEKLKSAIAEQQRSDEALRRSEKELRLLASQLLTAQENERRRMALDLHDNVSQTLAAMKWRIESALNEFDDHDAKAVELRKLIVPPVQETIEEVRNMYMRLRPSILDDLGLTATLVWLWRDFESTYPDIRIQRKIEVNDSDIPSDLKIVIYRVTQEGLSNAARHSKADTVQVTLTRKNNTVELCMEDNGVGFLMDEVLSLDDSLRGMGLSGMRERVELAGGTFGIDSKQGEGTRIHASWPLRH